MKEKKYLRINVLKKESRTNVSQNLSKYIKEDYTDKKYLKFVQI